jgi:tetratricopeptide (TPR) repeat protein
MGRTNRRVSGGKWRGGGGAAAAAARPAAMPGEMPAAMPAAAMDEPVTGEMTGEVTNAPEPGSLALWHESDRRDRQRDQLEHELEHRFFSAGLSQDTLLAASEREQEQEQALLAPRAGRVHKLVVGAAVGATVGVLAVGLLLRGPGVVAADHAVVATPPPEAAPAPAHETAPTAEPPAPDPATETPPALAAAQAHASVLDVAPADDARAACSQALLAGKFRDIRDRCAAAFAAAPEAELASEVARLAIENGRPSDAVRWARRALDVDPAFAPAFVYLGGGEQQRGNPRAARAAYARYLELAPDGPYAGDLQAVIASLGEEPAGEK